MSRAEIRAEILLIKAVAIELYHYTDPEITAGARAELGRRLAGLLIDLARVEADPTAALAERGQR